MKKKQRVMLNIVIAILLVITVLAAAFGIFYVSYKPTLSFDANDLVGEVTTGATGFLYGMSEEGVPSANMTESLKISSVSAKVKNGLQHPIGDVSHVASQLTKDDSFDYMVVYLQDVYKTWYYDHQNITDMKKEGTYKYDEYLTEIYFPAIKDTIESMLQDEYADKLVFCIFNECDNGIWFGHSEGEDQYHIFNSDDYKTFNKAWEMTYNYVKSLAPNVPIGGPGNYEYSSEKMDAFFEYTSKNNCLPDVIIYHELNDRSIYDWQRNVDDLHRLEQKYKIDTNLPIIVTEYGRMRDNGDPCQMARYISRIENSKVYANQAYWLMANNLCNTCADYNTPNSAWWIYRWYAGMQGQTMNMHVSDLFHSDLGKALKEHRNLQYQKFLGTASISDAKDSIRVIVSGTGYDGKVNIFNLYDTPMYKNKVKVSISRITFQGISAPVYTPEFVTEYIKKCGNLLNIDMKNMDPSSAYVIDITLTDTDMNSFTYTNDNLFTRYEFEDGTLLGDAYTYSSAYATTGGEQGMVGGMEKENDGVELTINIPEDGIYELVFIYGKANDGPTSKDRVTGTVNFEITNSDIKKELKLPNTIRSEITSNIHQVAMLKSGKHIIRFTNNDGTYVLDSMLIRRSEDSALYFVKDETKEDSYITVAPKDGYYKLITDKNAALCIDDAEVQADDSGEAIVFLRRGINYIDTTSNLEDILITEKQTNFIDVDTAVLSSNAKIEEGILTGISSKGGKAEFEYIATKKGTYRLTINYSNNLENGVHDYNVDLVEGYVTIDINGIKVKNLFCRNTYSDETFTTVTTNIDLEEGLNTISLYNDGSVTFDNNETFAPNIASISINTVSK